MKKTIYLLLASLLFALSLQSATDDGYKKLLIQQSRTPMGNLNSMLIFLADQLDINNDSKYFSQPTIVTSFVSLDNLQETSKLGRLISESLMHELQVRKWSVVEIKMTDGFDINKNGVFSLSRDLDRIKKTRTARSVVTGTYTTSDDTVIINAKVINAQSGVILSTGQIAIPFDSVAAMVFSQDQGDTGNGGDDNNEATPNVQ